MTMEIAAARKARAKRDAPERKRIAAHKRLVADVERIAHGPNNKPVATGQTIVKSRMNERPLVRLKRLDKLNAYEWGAANEIVAAYYVTVGISCPRDPDLGISSEPSAHAIEADEAGKIDARRNDMVVAYQRWRRELANTPELAAAIGMLLDEVSGYAMDRAERRQNGTTEKQMIDAVRHFAALRGNTPRGVRWRLHRRGGPLAEAERLARLVPRRTL